MFALILNLGADFHPAWCDAVNSPSGQGLEFSYIISRSESSNSLEIVFWIVYFTEKPGLVFWGGFHSIFLNLYEIRNLFLKTIERCCII